MLSWKSSNTVLDSHIHTPINIINIKRHDEPKMKEKYHNYRCSISCPISAMESIEWIKCAYLFVIKMRILRMMAPRGINIKCVHSLKISYCFVVVRPLDNGTHHSHRYFVVAIYLLFFILVFKFFLLEKHLSELLVPLKWNLNESHWQYEWTFLFQQKTPALLLLFANTEIWQQKKKKTKNRLKQHQHQMVFKQIVFAVSILSLCTILFLCRCACALYFLRSIAFRLCFTFLICCSKSMLSQANNHTHIYINSMFRWRIQCKAKSKLKHKK